MLLALLWLCRGFAWEGVEAPILPSAVPVQLHGVFAGLACPPVAELHRLDANVFHLPAAIQGKVQIGL